MRKLFLLALLPLAACQTKPIAEMGYSERRQLAESLVNRCLEQGVSLESREMETCTRAELQSSVARRERNRRTGRAIAEGLSQAGENMQRDADRRALIDAADRSRRVSCTSRGLGNTIQTNCY